MNNVEIHYGSISRRFVAFVIDAALLTIPCALTGHVIPAALIALLYAPVLESSTVKATLGKHWMGIQVTDLSGRRISFGTALTRFLIKLVSAALAFLPYGLALFTQRKQALHDLVPDTIVIYGREESSVWDAWMDNLKALFRTASQKVDQNGRVSDLERLQSLREKGTLTEEEFQKEKEKILGHA